MCLNAGGDFNNLAHFFLGIMHGIALNSVKNYQIFFFLTVMQLVSNINDI